MKEQTEQVAIMVAQKTSIGGAVVAVLGSVSSEWVFGTLGVLIALLGVYVTRRYSRKRDRREAAQHAAREARAQELHEAQLAFLRRKHSPDACDSMDLVEAQALGIDTADWPQSDMGALDGR